MNSIGFPPLAQHKVRYEKDKDKQKESSQHSQYPGDYLGNLLIAE